ncbi:AraC family transcriptional regulator [Thauera sp. WH-1]|uniref:AraC family transcriptional regulator n=1 Tax=Thauera sp. WH-1 TaxID=3398230 RepID=UPI0039FC7F49
MPTREPANSTENRRDTRNRASVAMGFVTGMLSGMHRQGRNPAPLLAATGIDLADTASRIPLHRYAALYNRVIAELDDEGFGLFSRSMPPGCFEFLCRGMLGAPTLAEALGRAGRFMRIVLPDLEVAVSSAADRAELRITERLPLGHGRDDPARVFAFEWLLRLLHGVASWFVGRGLALDAVDFPYRRPPHADDYALVYTEHSRFAAETDAQAEGDTRSPLVARFQANLLDLPIRRDEAALAAFLDGAPGKISMLYRRDREMVFRVRDLLRDALPRNLTVDEVARSLHLSSRSLHRRLEEEGSGFRIIKDAMRRDIALSRLAKTRQPITRIAAELGYADTSTFYRAFVAWTGVSPEHFRRRLTGGDTPAATGMT